MGRFIALVIVVIVVTVFVKLLMGLVRFFGDPRKVRRLKFKIRKVFTFKPRTKVCVCNDGTYSIIVNGKPAKWKLFLRDTAKNHLFAEYDNGEWLTRIALTESLPRLIPQNIAGKPTSYKYAYSTFDDADTNPNISICDLDMANDVAILIQNRMKVAELFKGDNVFPAYSLNNKDVGIGVEFYESFNYRKILFVPITSEPIKKILEDLRSKNGKHIVVGQENFEI